MKRANICNKAPQFGVQDINLSEGYGVKHNDLLRKVHSSISFSIGMGLIM